MKTALLLFLSTVIAKSKTAGHIDPWLIRAVDDLEACKKFPWGRFTFDHQLKWILKAANHFKGRILKSYTLPGFFHPASMLVCEAIPALREEFRIECDHTFDKSCPRMCKSEWAPTDMKGWPLDAINHVLGDTKEIDSTLTPTDDDEKSLLKDIMADDDLDFGACELTMNWNACIDAKKKIFFEDYFKLDVNGRAENLGIPKALSLKEELTKMFDEGIAGIKSTLGEVVEKLDNVDRRLTATEADLTKVMAWRIAIDPLADARTPDFDDTGAGVETEAEVGVETEANVGVETEAEVGVENEADAGVQKEAEVGVEKEAEVPGEEEKGEDGDEEEEGADEDEEEDEEDEGEEEEEEDEDTEEDEEFGATLASVVEKSKKAKKGD